MIVELIHSLGTWNWIIFGIVLLCVELVTPGAFMLWFGTAAIVVGVVSRFIHWGWQPQFVTFGVLSVLSVIPWLLLRRKSSHSDAPFLNRRADALVGRRFVLAEPIVSGRGRLSIDDTVWRIAGPDLPAGTGVKVVDTEGSRLVVEAAEI
jgi:inner membrane protein